MKKLKKLDKLKLKRDLFGLSLDRCPEHNLPLQHYDDDFMEEVNWNCPFFNEKGEMCAYHVHSYGPWYGVDFGEELNDVQKFLQKEDRKVFWPESKVFRTKNRILVGDDSC